MSELFFSFGDMRIHLYCDHKWRDLPNLTALALFLERMGHGVTIASGKETLAMTPFFRPDCVVLPHMYGTLQAEFAHDLQKAGVAVIVLPTEGTPRPELMPIIHGELQDYRPVDLFLNWSQGVTDGILSRGVVDAGKLRTIGCIRFDFYRQPFRQTIMSRESFCRRHDLDPTRPVITWTTNYAFANALETDQAGYRRWSEEMVNMGVKAMYDRCDVAMDDIPGFDEKFRLAAARGFFKLVDANPDFQFVIKPHPSENLAFYKARLEERQRTNVRFCYGEYIWDVLAGSDVLLSQHCTTAVEAWLTKLPTIELKLGGQHPLPWDHHERGSAVAHDADELIDLVRRSVNGEQAPADMSDYREKYIATWYHIVDGKRTKAAADEIDRFLRARGKRRTQVFVNTRRTPSPLRQLRATVGYALSIPASVSLRKGWNLRRNDAFRKEKTYDKYITRRDIAAQKTSLTSIVRRQGGV